MTSCYPGNINYWSTFLEILINSYYSCWFSFYLFDDELTYIFLILSSSSLIMIICSYSPSLIIALEGSIKSTSLVMKPPSFFISLNLRRIRISRNKLLAWVSFLNGFSISFIANKLLVIKCLAFTTIPYAP